MAMYKTLKGAVGDDEAVDGTDWKSLNLSLNNCHFMHVTLGTSSWVPG